MQATIRDRRIWELTQAEFVRLASQPSIPKSRLPLRREIDRHIDHTKVIIRKQLLTEILGKADVPIDLFERTSITYLAAQTHYDEVRRALQAGWAVPWRAIKDYPSLLDVYQCTSFAGRPFEYGRRGQPCRRN